MNASRYTVRHYSRDDAPAALAVANEALGPGSGFDRDLDFWRWKHESNPFGASLIHVAVERSTGRVVGVRALIPWEFEVDGRRFMAARAADSSVESGHRRRGLFSQLIEASVREARDRGIQLIWNTPNIQSIGAYRKISWSIVGRPRLLVQPGGPIRSATRLLGRLRLTRSPAGPAWPGVNGDDVLSSLSATSDLEGILRTAASLRGPGITTAHTLATLTWRYGAVPSRVYRVIRDRDTGGMLIVRSRTRRGLHELLLSELIVPDAGSSLRRLLRRLRDSCEADYLVAAAVPGSRLFSGLVASGFVPVPGIAGPRLACRVVGDLELSVDPTRLRAWRLSVGDLALL
jgi:GNAT superfamily N-acetyltransferase